MKNPYNLWPTKARLSTTVYQGERSELTKVQQKFEQVETVDSTAEALALYELFTMLPVGCWSINNIRGIISLNLHTHQLHSTPCMFIRSFEGRSAIEVKRKYQEYVQRIGGDQ